MQGTQNSQNDLEKEVQSWRAHTSQFKNLLPSCSNQDSVILALKQACRASLVAQWLGVCLLVRGTRVRALVWEDPTCRGAAGPVSHSYWACASGACAPQREGPRW